MYVIHNTCVMCSQATSFHVSIRRNKKIISIITLLQVIQCFGSAFFADPDPGKNLHADPDPGGKGKKMNFLSFFPFQMFLNKFLKK